MIRTALNVMLMVALAASTGACNTVRGVGQDMQAGGQKLKNAVAHHSEGTHCKCDNKSSGSSKKSDCACS